MSLIRGRSHRVAWIADLSVDLPVSTLKNRSEVPAAETWDLTPIFRDDLAWEAEFSDLASRYEEINAFKGTLAKSAEDLATALAFESSLDRSSERLNQYAGLRLSEDS